MLTRALKLLQKNLSQTHKNFRRKKIFYTRVVLIFDYLITAIGLQGIIGIQGPEGYKGERGEMGIPGRGGLHGLRGLRGDRGDPAPAAPPPKSRGFIYAKHSQSVAIPNCPINTDKLWDGYSFINVVGNSRSVGQDLGSAGSCLRRFSTMPFLFCDINNVCNYAQNNDDSIWLSTAEPMPMTMTPIAARDMERYISRCSVCESRTKMIALHSQSMTIPNCPDTWEESWIGYSYLMVNFY